MFSSFIYVAVALSIAQGEPATAKPVKSKKPPVVSPLKPSRISAPKTPSPGARPNKVRTGTQSKARRAARSARPQKAVVRPAQCGPLIDRIGQMLSKGIRAATAEKESSKQLDAFRAWHKATGPELARARAEARRATTTMSNSLFGQCKRYGATVFERALRLLVNARHVRKRSAIYQMLGELFR